MFIFFLFSISKTTKTMSCGINSGWKMLISVQQCMRNTFNSNNKIFLCRRLNTLKKALRPVSLVRLSHPFTKSKAIYEKSRANALLENEQFLFPLACNLYSNHNGKVAAGEKEQVKSEVKVSLYQKLKKMYKEYWYILVPVHLITSTVWFGGFYYLASSGIDIPSLLQSLGAPDSWIQNLKNSKAGNLVLAYTLYKVATPLRYTVTIGGTTISINYLMKWGWIKPVPNKEQIKKMYQEQKDAFKDKMQVTKTGFLKNKHEMKGQIETAKEEFHKMMSETRQDIKQGIQSGAEEWKIMSKLFTKEVKKIVKSDRKKSD